MTMNRGMVILIDLLVNISWGMASCRVPMCPSAYGKLGFPFSGRYNTTKQAFEDWWVLFNWGCRYRVWCGVVW